jgi:hypothetical protein
VICCKDQFHLLSGGVFSALCCTRLFPIILCPKSVSQIQKLQVCSVLCKGGFSVLLLGVRSHGRRKFAGSESEFASLEFLILN